MSADKKLIQRYLRVSRIIGVFPLRKTKSGSLEFSLCSPLTFISIALAGFYTVYMFDVVLNRLDLKQLSERIEMWPVVFTAVLTDHLIRISSMRYSGDLIKFLSLPQPNMKQSRHSASKMRYLGVGPTVYAVYTVIRLIVELAVAFDKYYSLEAAKRGTVWDGLLYDVFLQIAIVCRDASYWCAFWFVTLFGEKVMERFELICEEIMEYSEASTEPGYPGQIKALKEPKAFEVHVKGAGCANKLKIGILEMKTAFEIYSKIGGTFSFAVVVSIWTWAFSSVCAALFGGGNSVSFVHQVCESMMAALTLMTVAEVGHQIGSKVGSSLISDSKAMPSVRM